MTQTPCTYGTIAPVAPDLRRCREDLRRDFVEIFPPDNPRVSARRRFVDVLDAGRGQKIRRPFGAGHGTVFRADADPQ